MSNKPKIYGTCAAGCLWETIHKEELETIAAVIPIYQDAEGKYILEVGKKYKIESGYHSESSYLFRDFTVTLLGTNSTLEAIVNPKTYTFRFEVDQENYAQYNDCVIFKILDLTHERIIYSVDGVIKTKDLDFNVNLYDGISISVENAMAVYLYNEDATITAKSAYEVAVDNGFDGTEAEWLASIGSIKLAQGFGYSAGAVMSQLAVTEAFEAIGSGEVLATPTEGLAYELNADGNGYKCIGIGTATDTDIVIASHINDIPVTTIGSGAFLNCEVKIESVYIPHTVTEILDAAFRKCLYLKNVVISNGVTTIGEQAFFFCTRLEVVKFGARVDSICRYAFWFCLSLKEIKLPDSLTRIEERAFEDAFSLKSAFIPASVTYMGANAFGAHDVDPDDPQPEDEYAGCPNLSIYCEAKEKPSGWDETWNSENRPVAWGYITDAEKIVRETANALKATASGKKVTIEDISPITHTPRVQLRSKNILRYPYQNTTMEKNGITFTANADGSVTVNGTATANADFGLYNGACCLTAGTYGVLGVGATSNVRFFGEFYNNSSWIAGFYVTGTGKSFALTEANVANTTRLYICVSVTSGTTVNNLTLYPMIAKDTIPTEYTPYITDFSGLTLKRYGETESEFPETYTANADGTVNGVTSLYPTMTLEAPEAATVEVEYNRDTQAALDGKLDKVTTTGGNRIYGIQPSGQQKEFTFSPSANYAYSAPMRDESLTFEVGEPKKPKHPATKQFVEDAVGRTTEVYWSEVDGGEYIVTDGGEYIFGFDATPSNGHIRYNGVFDNVTWRGQHDFITVSGDENGWFENGVILSFDDSVLDNQVIIKFRELPCLIGAQLLSIDIIY